MKWNWKRGFFGVLLAMFAREEKQVKPAFRLAENDQAPAPKKDKARESLVIKRARQRKAKRGF